jgi:acyl-homoserine-lactone acylase
VKTEILWDTYGIPHIYGQNDKSLFHAFGWAQMQSHGNLILRLYGQARGRAAEYWGEKYRESDQWVRTMGIPDRAHQWYEAQSSTFRSDLDAFAAGVNAYVQEHPDSIDDAVEGVLPINGVDLLAHLQRVLHFTFMVDPQQVASLTDPLRSAKAVPSTAVGSNAWAIAPARSASGNAMLLANPHAPWSDEFLWYEAQLTTSDVNASGATLVGIPVLAIAFNDYLGWAHTVNAYDGWDAYELTLVNGGYLFDSQVQPFETEQQTLKVRQDDGSLREEPLSVRHSVHGPVIIQKDDKAIALRVAGLEQPKALEQWWQMIHAKNLTEFEMALKRLQIPMFTVIYADRDGHILHLFNGQVPVHAQGDFEYWTGVVPGNTTATLWTQTHPYQDLPRVIDPPSGWLQNANDPPWTTTLPLVLNPDNYPPYMAPRDSMEFRAQHSARMLAEDEQISFEEMIKYKHSTRMELADRLLDDLVPAARQQGGELARRAADVLDAWDHQAEAGSRGAVLFAAWAQAVETDRLFAVPWDKGSPLDTPDGLANPVSAIAVLETVAARIEATYGALDVAWGDVFRLHYGDTDLPANGGPGSLGIFRVLDFAQSDADSFQLVNGETYVAAIEFSNPVRARVLTSYGNASQPNSPYFGDQLKLFARKELRPVWRSRKEVEAHLTLRQEF